MTASGMGRKGQKKSEAKLLGNTTMSLLQVTNS